MAVHDTPTVRVLRDGMPFVVINEDDYDPNYHTLYEEPGPEDESLLPDPRLTHEDAPAAAQDARGALSKPPGINPRRKG